MHDDELVVQAVERRQVGEAAPLPAQPLHLPSDQVEGPVFVSPRRRLPGGAKRDRLIPNMLLVLLGVRTLVGGAFFTMMGTFDLYCRDRFGLESGEHPPLADHVSRCMR